MSSGCNMCIPQNELKKKDNTLQTKSMRIQSSLQRYSDARHIYSIERLNRAIARSTMRGLGIASKESILAKLNVSQPGDKYEKEADRVADRVMSMPQGDEKKEEQSVQMKSITENITPFVQRESGEEKKDETMMTSIQKEGEDEKKNELQTKSIHNAIQLQGEQGNRRVNPKRGVTEEDVLRVKRIICPECNEGSVQAQLKSRSSSEINPAIESKIQKLHGGGQPLPENIQRFFGERFGYNFSNVRIHRDTESSKTAEGINAKAFTTGSNIVFSQGQYAPETTIGRKLLAHELTHVVQQSRSTNMQLTEEGAKGRSIHRQIEISRQNSSDHIQRHTKEYCDEMYDLCGDGCRRLPNRTRTDKARRALCWSRCMAEYAACLASSEEALTGLLTAAAIIAAIVLASADGPFPIGDAAAAALLVSLGIL